MSEHTSPGRLAAAVLVGCVVGCTPLIGFHFFVCVALAFLLGLNKVVVYGAANLSIPPLMPFIGFVSVQLGERLRHHRWLSLRRADVHLAGVHAFAKEFFFDWMLGGVILGAAIGLTIGGLVFVALSRRRRAGDALAALIEAARRRYDGLHPRFKWYARMKYVMDPCYRAIAGLVPPRAFLVDLGSGLGMLPVLIGLLGEERRALGVEWDRVKVDCATVAARDLAGVSVVEGDARAFPIPRCDVITLVDMLHYFDADEQRALIGNCRRALPAGGLLLVREGDAARPGGARFTRLVERVVTRLGWNRGPAVRFRPVEALRADLEALGFAVEIDDVAARTHPGNVLLRCVAR